MRCFAHGLKDVFRTGQHFLIVHVALCILYITDVTNDYCCNAIALLCFCLGTLRIGEIVFIFVLYRVHSCIRRIKQA